MPQVGLLTVEHPEHELGEPGADVDGSSPRSASKASNVGSGSNGSSTTATNSSCLEPKKCVISRGSTPASAAIPRIVVRG